MFITVGNEGFIFSCLAVGHVGTVVLIGHQGHPVCPPGTVEVNSAFTTGYLFSRYF